MLPLRCSRPSISVSKSISFWPSTIARRRSSGCVALISIRLHVHSSAARHQWWPRRTQAAAARPLATNRCTRKRREETGRNRPGLRGCEMRSRDRRPGQRWRARSSEGKADWEHAGDHWDAKPKRDGPKGARERRSSRGSRLRPGNLLLGSCLFALPSRASKPPRHLGTRPAEAAGRCITVLPEQDPAHHPSCRWPAPRFAALITEKSNTYSVVWTRRL